MQLWEDEVSSDKSSPSLEDAGNHVAANGIADDDDAEEVSSCLVVESKGHEDDKCDSDPHMSVDDAIEHTVNEIESKEEECLISLDEDVELSGPAAGKDPAECHLETHEDHNDSDPHVNVEDASEHTVDEIENKEEECLIGLDEDADLSGPSAGNYPTECHLETHEDHNEDDIPSDSQHPADADDVASDDHMSIQECNAGEM